MRRIGGHAIDYVVVTDKQRKIQGGNYIYWPLVLVPNSGELAAAVSVCWEVRTRRGGVHVAAGSSPSAGTTSSAALL